MALAGTEEWRGGFVVDKTTGYWRTITDPTGTSWQGGFTRDSDGRILVTNMSSNVVWHNGLPFDATTGALLVGGGSGANPTVAYAGTWDGAKAYSVGDMVVYSNKPYICKLAVAAAGSQSAQAVGSVSAGQVKVQGAGAKARTITDADSMPAGGIYEGAFYRAHVIQMTLAATADVTIAISSGGGSLTAGFDLVTSAAARVGTNFQNTSGTINGIAGGGQATNGSRWYLFVKAYGDSTPPLDAPVPYTLTLTGSLVAAPNDPPPTDTTHWDQVST